MRHFLAIFAVGILGIVLVAACKSTDQSQSNRALASPTPADGIRRITVVELQELVNKNEAFIVDVRTQSAFDTAHIKGAKLMPVGDILNFVDQLPKDKLIVTYCA